MNIDEMIDKMTVGDVKQIAALLGNSRAEKKESFFKVGQCYLVRGVTNYIVGKVERINDTEILFSDASWVADMGRFYDAFKTGKLNEVEPVPNGVVIMNRGSWVDAFEWAHPLPTEQK